MKLHAPRVRDQVSDQSREPDSHQDRQAVQRQPSATLPSEGGAAPQPGHTESPRLSSQRARLAQLRSSVPAGAVMQRYLDSSGTENNIEPIGVQLHWDYGQGKWVRSDGQALPDAQQPPALVLSFAPGTTTPTSKEQRRRKKLELAKQRRAAYEKRMAKKFSEIDDDAAVVPSGATAITLDPYGLEQEITQRQANLYKTLPLGVKVHLHKSSYRNIDLGFLPEPVLDALLGSPAWYLHDGLIWAQVSGGISFVASFDTGNIEKLERALCIKYLVLNEEAQPRSGAGRAAADDQHGKLRQPAKDEAFYLGSQTDLHHIEPEEAPHFSASRSDNAITATVTHKGPWKKGVRDPGQSQVMGQQNAKNYIAEQTNPYSAPYSASRHKTELGGRWEWLHLVGSSLGGPNTAYNLVAGSYDANTKMIALEHRVANWGALGYEGEFKPSAEKPLQISSQASVAPAKSHVADTITTTVSHGGKQVVSGSYRASDQTVITKSAYAEEEERVGKAIDQARSQ